MMPLFANGRLQFLSEDVSRWGGRRVFGEIAFVLGAARAVTKKAASGGKLSLPNPATDSAGGHTHTRAPHEPRQEGVAGEGGERAGGGGGALGRRRRNPPR